MHVTDIAIWAFVTEAITIVTGLALFVVIIWQAPRHRDNQLMGLYMVTLILWGASNSLARISAILGLDNSFPFYTSALFIALNAYMLFVLASHYANLWHHQRIQIMLFMGLAVLVLGGPQLYQGHVARYVPITTGDMLEYEIAPLGYFLFAVYYTYYLGALACLWLYRRKRAGALLTGAAITCLGVLTSVLPVLKDLPLDIMSAAVGGLFFARAILNEKLFNPLAEANERLTRLANELRESEANLSALIESTPDMVWSADTDFHILTINTAFRQAFSVAFGIDLQKGMRFIDYVPANLQPTWTSLYETALSGERVSVEQYYELRGLLLYVEVSLTPIRTADGRVTGVAAFSRDITERKLAESTLRRQNEYLNALHETALGLMRRLKITELLEAIITRAADLVGTSNGYIYLVEPDGKEMTLRVGIGAQAGHVGNHLRPGEGMAGKIWLTGEPLVVDDYNTWAGKIPALDDIILHAAVCVPLKSEQQVIGAIGLVYLEEGRKFSQAEVEILSRFAELASLALDNARLYDTLQKELEDRKRAEEAAEAANRAKSTFLANMSHELRTPLNAIIGYSEMLQEDAEAEGHLELLPDLQKINTAGKHLLGLISDILDLSKIEAGKMTINLEEFDLARLIYDTVATIQPLVEKNGNTLKITCPDNLGTIISDPTRVRQCLFNLLSNAAKFTSNGIITFEVGRSDRHSDECQADVLASILTAVSGYPSLVVFRVTDTGIGIPLEQIPNLFQPFTQVDPSATRKYGGTGLGLAITKRFCQIMGGDISVESEPGKGSVFTLWLPTIRASNAKVNPDIEVGESSI